MEAIDDDTTTTTNPTTTPSAAATAMVKGTTSSSSLVSRRKYDGGGSNASSKKARLVGRAPLAEDTEDTVFPSVESLDTLSAENSIDKNDGQIKNDDQIKNDVGLFNALSSAECLDKNDDDADDVDDANDADDADDDGLPSLLYSFYETNLDFEDDSDDSDDDSDEDVAGADDEAENERMMDPTSGRQEEDLDRFLFGITACPVSREILRPYLEKIPEKVSRYFVDMRSDCFDGLKKRKTIRHHAGIYVIVDENNKVVKVGYTKDFIVRQAYYKDNGTLDSHEFIPIFDLDLIDQEMSEEINAFCSSAQQALLLSDQLHPCQKHFYQQMFEREGACLGFKTTFALGLLESGFQTHFGGGLECTMEFLAFDKAKCDALYKDCAVWGQKLFDLMPPAIKRAAKDGTLRMFMISSWAIGGKKIQFKLKPIANNLFDCPWKNTMPDPVFPDATTAEQIYCCDFSPQERKEGREDRLYVWLKEYLSGGPSVVFMDSNAVLFDDDPHSDYGTAYEMLEEKFRLQQQLSFQFGRELIPYVDEAQEHALMVNRPYCGVSDSRSFRTLLQKIRRTRTLAVSLNFNRLLHGRAPLSPYFPEDEFQDPLRGITSVQMLAVGGKSNGIRCTPFFKDSCTDKSLNPLVGNNITKIPSMEASVSKLLRQVQVRPSNAKMRQDKLLDVEFRAIVTQFSRTQLDGMYDMLCQRAMQGTKLVKTAQARFKNTLMKRVVVGPLKEGLVKIYKDRRDNVGNAGATGIKDEQILANNAILTAFVQQYAQSKTQAATPFFIRTAEHVPIQSRADLGNEHPVLDILTFSGLESRTVGRAKSETGSNRVSGVKFTELGINKVQPKVVVNGYVLATLLPRKTRKRSDAEVAAEYKAFIPRHKPPTTGNGKGEGRPFWIKIDVKTKELYNADFVHADESIVSTSFPRGLEIYNAHVFTSLQGYYKRLLKKGDRASAYYRIKTHKFEEHGYRLISLKEAKIPEISKGGKSKKK